jgi:hypothetical protein
MAQKYITLSEEALDKLLSLVRESHSVAEGIDDENIATNSTYSSAKLQELLGDVGVQAVELTKAEYDALSDEEKNSETIYFIKDINESGEIISKEVLLYEAEYATISEYTIPDVDFRGYKTIRILYALSNTKRCLYLDAYIDENTIQIPLQLINLPGGIAHLYNRNLIIENGTMTIGIAYDYLLSDNTKTENNALLVPLKIWGIKD